MSIKLAIKISEQPHWRGSTVFIVNFKHYMLTGLYFKMSDAPSYLHEQPCEFVYNKLLGAKYSRMDQVEFVEDSL